MQLLTSTIQEYSKKWGPCGLIELDTITEAFSIQDENAPREWLDIQHACRELGRAVGGCVDAIHHTGKDASRGGRGSSAIGGSHDFSVTCEIQPDGSTRVGPSAGDKMRDVSDRSYPQTAFRIETHVLDTALDIFGDAWTSGYPVACSIITDQPVIDRNGRDQVLHDAFNDVEGVWIIDAPNIGKRNGKPLERVRHHFMNRYDGNGDAKRQAWSKLIKMMRNGEHNEYIIANDTMIVSISVDSALAFDMPTT
jgi:hypothetical protein